MLSETATALLPGGSSKLELLIVGSAIHIDTQQPAFSMAGAKVPADSHLVCRIEESVFGLLGGGKPLKDVRVHWLTYGTVWQGDLHEMKVRRMWAAYIDLRGGALATFKGDPKAVFDELGAASASPVNLEPPFEGTECRPTMTLVRRDADNKSAEALFTPKEVRREAIPQTPAKIRIGLRWEGGARADIDLYAKTKAAKAWIYFGEPETGEGKFFKYEADASKPSKGFEYIEFNDVIDPAQIQIAVNFYSGNVPGGPKGKVRLDIGGTVYEVDIQIRSAQGNKGLGFPDKMGRHPAWVLINAADIVSGKLSFASPTQ